MTPNNYFINSFRKLHEKVFNTESFLFTVASSLRKASHHAIEEANRDHTENQEILGSISLIWDITAKDNASQVKNDLSFEMKRHEYPKRMEELISREASRDIATIMEYFEAFLKDSFTAVLCIDASISTDLNIPIPTIIPSFEDIRDLVSRHKIEKAPFKKKTANGTAIRKFLLKKFPRLKTISEKENSFKINYSKLIDTLVMLRHDITHRDRVLGEKTKKELITIKKNLNIVEVENFVILEPTDEQVKAVSARILEYAFTITKFLSIQYGLGFADYTYSNKPELMLMEGKWPIL